MDLELLKNLLEEYWVAFNYSELAIVHEDEHNYSFGCIGNIISSRKNIHAISLL